MLKYCKVINEETKEVSIGLGTNTDYYKSIGFEEKEIIDINGKYYLKGYEPKLNLEQEKEKLLTILKDNTEKYIYNHYPLYRQNNIAIYGTEEERNNFKIFKEHNTEIYHKIVNQINNIKTEKELKNIDVSINIFVYKQKKKEETTETLDTGRDVDPEYQGLLDNKLSSNSRFRDDNNNYKEEAENND